MIDFHYLYWDIIFAQEIYLSFPHVAVPGETHYAHGLMILVPVLWVTPPWMGRSAVRPERTHSRTRVTEGRGWAGEEQVSNLKQSHWIQQSSSEHSGER